MKVSSQDRTRQPLRGRALVWRWFRTVTLAELLGFSVPALVGATVSNSRPAVALPALLLAGSVEGAMLGLGQAAVLRRALPELRTRTWIIATSLAAAFAYLLGLTPSMLANSISDWPIPLVVAGSVVLGLALLASIGAAQWLVLRNLVSGSSSWIATTALAWLAGLAIFLGFAMPLWQPGQPLILIIAIAIAGGFLMAATSSAITGTALRRLLQLRTSRAEDH
ncbi:hypothetical protein OHA18_41590 [Kribbella sp. NBC_00709]|uniref:hypothetical protein n=1 Tax=Kribbella sp. NBC_00709 TaxID=2975972 RepID=UPI002E2C1F0C|nr:hypothetical protein [Kribbella sp. NBC_00709]